MMRVGIQRLAAGVITLGLAACVDGDFGRTLGPDAASDERVSQFRADLARNPGNVRALVGIGEEYERRASWALATGAYNEALIVDDGNRTAQLGFSIAQSALGQYRLGLEHAQRALAQRADVEAYIAAAIALNGQQRHGEAKQLLEAALELNPRDLDTRNNLALTLALMGDGQAYSIQRAVALAPDADLRHHRNFFLVAAILGQESNARADAASLGLSETEIKAVSEIGRKARRNGMNAFGLTAKL